MIRYRKEERTETVFIVEAMHCNKCGQEIDLYGERYEIEHTGGYASKIGDGIRVSFELCEPCVQALMATFAIPATLREEDWYLGPPLEAEPPSTTAPAPSDPTPEADPASPPRA